MSISKAVLRFLYGDFFDILPTAVQKVNAWCDLTTDLAEKAQRQEVARRIIIDLIDKNGSDICISSSLCLKDFNLITSLPEGLNVRRALDLSGWTGLTSLPEGLNVGGSLDLSGCIGLTSLPAGLNVWGSLDLSGCIGLTSLPAGLNVGGPLYLSSCIGLTSLPAGLNVGGSLDLIGCIGLTSLPAGLNVGGSLDLSGCTGLTSLPEGLNVGRSLYLSGCTGLTSLPAGLNVGGSLDLIGCTGLIGVLLTPQQAVGGRVINSDPVALQEETYTVARTYITQQPIEAMEVLAALSQKRKVKIKFEGEDGIDAGGVWREFIRILFSEIVKEKMLFAQEDHLFTLKKVPSEKEQECLAIFRNIGILIGTIYKRKDAAVGALFKPQLLKAMLSAQSATKEGYTLNIVKELSVGDFSKTEELFKAAIWNADNDFCWDNKEEGVQELQEQFPVKELKAMADGFFSVSAPAAPDALVAVLEGESEPQAIANLCVYEGNDPKMIQQVEWLKEWILQSKDNTKKFLAFATGSGALPQSMKLVILSHTNDHKYLQASTCFGQVYLPLKYQFASKNEFFKSIEESVPNLVLLKT